MLSINFNNLPGDIKLIIFNINKRLYVKTQTNNYYLQYNVKT